MDKVRVFEAFCGYGSQALALERLKTDYPEKFDFEVVGISDIEKYPLMAYQALHGHCPNFGDITKIDWEQVPDFDLFTYSSPCQDISMAGLQRGLEKGSGTRSSLLWECEKAIKTKRPKWLLFENVEAIVSEKFLPHIVNWMNILSMEYGYRNYLRVLEATDFGIPQTRRRCFIVSVLDDCEPKPYYFPLPLKKKAYLHDFLEDDKDVPPSCDLGGRRNYYERVLLPNGDFGTIDQLPKKLLDSQCFHIEKDSRDPRGQRLKPNSKPDISGTVLSHHSTFFAVKRSDGSFRLRIMTEKEAFRLMGLRDSDIAKIDGYEPKISKTAKLKMAGNSIVVDVLYHIFRKLYVDTGCEPNRQIKLF